MLKTIRKTLESKEESVPTLSEQPTSDELQQLLENHRSVESGFFKDVYETEQNVVKLPSHPGALEGAEDQIDHVEGKNIGPDTIIGFHDLALQGYMDETPVVIQEKYDSSIIDLDSLDTERFLNSVVDTIDTALQNNIVLQDASIINFGLFDQEVRYIDIADKESLVAFNPPKDRSSEEYRAFMGNASSMYNAFVRTVSQNTDYSREQAISYISQHSQLLDGAREIELPEHSIITGIEQRLENEVTGTPENTY